MRAFEIQSHPSDANLAETPVATVANEAHALSADRTVLLEFTLNRLVLAGLISDRDRNQLTGLLAKTREPLDAAICSLALVTEEKLADAFASIFGYARTETNIDSALHRSMSPEFLRSKRVFPLREQEDRVLVAVADPTEVTGVRGCEFALRKPAAPVIATASELEALFQRFEPTIDPNADVDLIQPGGNDAERLRDLASTEPAVRLCNRLVAEAAKARASDIHLEPEERAYRVRFRIDGKLVERESLSVKQGLAVISRFKILSNLDIAERRRPQDGRFSFPVAGRPVDLRISATPNVHGEGVVLRLLQRSDVSFDLEALGFTPEAASLLHRLSARPNGIILLTGPTGSGKTTTLYALLQRLAEREVKILTVEDPVEYKISGVSQTQVNPAIGLTFASALRSFLRHDPDIIMVGEMRDLETARTAVQAALTGHLVLSTLHTNDAPSAVMRLLDMGVEDYLVASTLVGVVGQRLVRKCCSACGGLSGPRELSEAPCSQCEGSGFYGRLAIAEILEVDDSLRSAIKGQPTAAELTRIARFGGFVGMKEDGEAKIAGGQTTRQELLKAVAE